MATIFASFLVLAASAAGLGGSATQARYETLLKEYESADKAWGARYPVEAGMESKVDWVARYREYPAWDFAPRFLKLAEADIDDPAAVDALLWIVGLRQSVSLGDRALLPHVSRALTLLSEKLQDERIGPDVCRGISDTLLPAAEQFLRVAKEKGRDRETRGVACLGLAQSLMERGSARTCAGGFPTPFCPRRSNS